MTSAVMHFAFQRVQQKSETDMAMSSVQAFSSTSKKCQIIFLCQLQKCQQPWDATSSCPLHPSFPWMQPCCSILWLGWCNPSRDLSLLINLLSTRLLTKETLRFGPTEPSQSEYKCWGLERTVCALSSISKSEKKETGKMKLLYPLVVFLFVAVSVQSLVSGE